MEHPPETPVQQEVRQVLDASESGAPAAGKAVRDIFSTDEIFERILATANEEFSRSNQLLFLSGLAAGLSISLSFLARAALTAALPDSPTPVGNLLYPVGFIFIVIGRYQLFTENTLTPVTLVLTRQASIPRLLRVWGVVLFANVLGAALAALFLAKTEVLSEETVVVARAFAEHGLEASWTALFNKGIFAGWLVAGMVWLIHAARDSVTRFLLVFFIMFLIPTVDLFHCIVGACEILYLVFLGGTTLGTATFDFFLPVVLGNTVGGVLLVALLNYAQTNREEATKKIERLGWREWCVGR